MGQVTQSLEWKQWQKPLPPKRRLMKEEFPFRQGNQVNPLRGKRIL